MKKQSQKFLEKLNNKKVKSLNALDKLKTKFDSMNIDDMMKSMNKLIEGHNKEQEGDGLDTKKIEIDKKFKEAKKKLYKKEKAIKEKEIKKKSKFENVEMNKKIGVVNQMRKEEQKFISKMKKINIKLQGFDSELRNMFKDIRDKEKELNKVSSEIMGKSKKQMKDLKEAVKPVKSHIEFYLYVIEGVKIDKETGKLKIKRKYQTKDVNKKVTIGIRSLVSCLTTQTVINHDFVQKYELDKLYYNLDTENSFQYNISRLEINKLVDELRKTSYYIDNRIDRVLISLDILGFKITSREIIDDKRKRMNLNNIDVQQETKIQGINTKYTHYKANLNATSFNNLLVQDYIPYVQENYHKDSCYLTCIINTYYNTFNAIKSDGNRRHKELTYKRLAEILEIDYKPSNMAVSTNLVIEKFFKKYNFSIFVYDPFMKLITSYKSENKHATSMRVIYKDEHVYLLNENIKSLQQLVENPEIVFVNNKYNIFEKKKVHEVLCFSEEEIIKEITKYIQNDNLDHLKIISDYSLDELLFKIMFDGEYMPNIKYTTQIDQINYYINKKLIEIVPNNNVADGSCCDVTFTSLKDYTNYSTAYDRFYNQIIKKEYISEHHPSVLQYEANYKISPISGYFNKYSQVGYNCLDVNKAYSDACSKINQIPIFSYFDVYKIYDNHEIEDLTLYKIKLLPRNNEDEATIIFNAKNNIVYGYVLKQLPEFKYIIQYYRRPLNTEYVNYKQDVEEIFNNPNLEMDEKKGIANTVLGLLEKNKNRREITKVFKDFHEAYLYAKRYNTEVIRIKGNEKVKFHEHIDENGMKSWTPEVTGFNKLYLVKMKDEKQLITNLLPIKNMIYYNMRLKLLDMFRKMKKIKNITIHGIKTDCLLFSGCDEKILKQHFTINNEIGNYKIEENKFLVDKELSLITNKHVKIQNFENINLKQFEDEYNTTEINNYIKNTGNILITAVYPGCGKSEIAKKYTGNTLFVCPYNVLCQKLKQEKHNAITYDKLFGLIFKNDNAKTAKKNYDISEYDTIVFEEIYLYTAVKLKRISEFMEKNKDKLCIANGDPSQRNPIDTETPTWQNKADLKTIINIMFPNQIRLNIIKRFGNNDDKEKIKLMKDDIFGGMPIVDICKKYNINMINKMEDVRTTKNICLFKFRCDMVNNHVNKKIMKNKNYFIEGNEYLCRKYEKKKDYILHTNYTYRLMKLLKTTAVLKDEVEDIEYNVSIGTLNNCMKLPFSNTCDSVQGLSIENEITIFDANTHYVNKKYIWTALTRARALKNVTFFIHNKNEVENLTSSRIRLYFTEKIRGYKYQDKKANRRPDVWDITPPTEYYELGFLTDILYNGYVKLMEYVNEDWIFNKIVQCKNKCNKCRKQMEIVIDDGDVYSNLTVDRIDNNLSHFKNNCQLLCHSCNSSKGNRY